jgi:hypothetical protein
VALTYDAAKKEWNNAPEKTDYDTSRVTGTTLYPIKGISGSFRNPGPLVIKGYTTNPNYKDRLMFGPKVYPDEGFRIDQNSSQELKNYAEGSGDWAVNAQRNADDAALNEQNTKKNNFYNSVNSIIGATNNSQYDYLDAKAAIAKAAADAGVPAEELDKMVSETGNFRTFYANEKVPRWDTALGANPPYGSFDAKYYKEQRPDAKAAWNDAVKNDDLDVIARYDENSFYLQDYTTTGKSLGIRGNSAEVTEQTNKYLETKPTDKTLQDVRDLQLGVDTNTQTNRLLNIPEIKAEWEKAKQGDPYWSKQAKEKYLNPSKEDEFVALFRLSERPQDKQVSLNNNINAGYGVTELEDALNQVVGQKALVDVKRFGALAQNVLKDTIEEMKKAKAQEQNLALFNSFDGFSEITNINKTLANSILGDTGVGGILSFTSSENPEKSLEKSLQNITGVNNNTTYNWQKWFDTALKTKYSSDYNKFEPLEEKRDIIKAFTSEKTKGKVFDESKQQFTEDFLKRSGFTTTQKLVDFLKTQETDGQTILNTIKSNPGDSAKVILDPILSTLTKTIEDLDKETDRSLTLNYTADGKNNDIKIDAQFARDFIDDYLTPRFNTSRSMNELVEYLDVRQEEQNPFQTQDLLNATSQIANLRAQAYLDQLKATDDRSFDFNFYFNPTGDKTRERSYAEQASTVASDWEAAKKGDEYWAQQAYRFGVDLNNKEAFARMHFQVKGQGKGYDGAEDILNAGKVQDEIFNNILPALKAEALKQGSIFGKFVTPDEFADEALRGIDPTDKEAWNEVLEQYGLTGVKGSVDEIKEYIKETLRTGSAQEIREKIKGLNEKREKPTQEVLGITYIERPEDFTNKPSKSQTELFTTFQSAGYQGTEDDFYNKFFPDVDRSEQIFLTKAGKGTSLETNNIDLSDPFASLGTIGDFLDEDTSTTSSKTKSSSPSSSSFFSLGSEEDEDTDYKSKTGQKILGEFTSLFKGY